MKTAILSVLSALLLSTLSSAQTFKEAELKTSISEVTVFLQGAQITRSGKVDIPEGKSLLTIKSLSPHIDEKSIQVSAMGDFTVLSVNHSFDYLNERIRSKRVDSLQQQIESLELEVKTKESRMTILKEKLSLLDANKDLNGKDSGMPLSQLKQAIEFYDQELSSIKKEELETALKIRELNENKTKLEKQISDVSQQEKLPSGQIEIRVDAQGKAKGSFTITYLVANAGWYPSYDVRVKNVESPIELRYKADVYQNTGVDWKNVNLRFSNANPNKSGVAPELSTWHLNYARNTVYLRNESKFIDPSVRTVRGKVIESETGEALPGVNILVKGSTVGTTTDFEGNYQLTLPNDAEYLVFSFIGMMSEELPINATRMDVVMEPDDMQLDEVVVTGYSRSRGLSSRASEMSTQKTYKAKTITTTAIENQTTVEFEVKTPYSIASNGTKLTIDLNKFEIETLYEYYAVPKLDKDAFLLARILHWDQYNLLEGEANLFFEDSFVGRSVLDANALTDTLNLSLGRDRSIVIGRVKKEEFSKRRTIGSNKVDSRGFEIVARNGKAQPIKLTLYDQVPVAAISDISVTPTQLSGGSLNPKTGEVTWELNLAPKERTQLNLVYEVKYPKREQVNIE